MQPSNDNLIWIDLEMTGLDVEQDKIIEIATIITDKNLDIIAEGPVLAIHQSNTMLEGMDNWNTKQHTRSGLVERVRNSQTTMQEAEEATLEFVMTHVPPQKSPICGNGICQDRRFLARYMPSLERYFHYKNLDVSVVGMLARFWKPEILENFTKELQHLAQADILESIKELRFYKQHFLNCGK